MKHQKKKQIMATRKRNDSVILILELDSVVTTTENKFSNKNALKKQNVG